MTPGPRPGACVTVDLHDVDLPDDIVAASAWLGERRVAATFFVPSALLRVSRYQAALREVVRAGHEVGNHSHEHDWREIEALASGGPESLSFLALGRRMHEDFFQARPRAFRAPRWCYLGRPAREELVRLGYEIDSSVTPQRLPFINSMPFSRGWFLARRRPFELHPGLLEIATSCLLVPAASPTFLTLRRASFALLALLEAESDWLGERPLVLMIHVEDLVPDSTRDRHPGPFSLRDVIPRRRGGFGFKWFLRDRDPRRIARLHREIVERLRPRGFATLATLADSWWSHVRAG